MNRTPQLASRLTKSSAFTLIEIMMVVMIIGLLLGFAVNQLGGNLATAQETKVRADIQTLKTQLTVYEGTNGFPPSTDQGLRALVQQPSSSPTPRNWRKLMDEVPLDPWGREYQYLQPGRRNPDSFDIFSAGKDGTVGTDDDIGNWKK
ncbi:MAG: ral secretion pathway protein [Verrucomicrobiota bacterium]|jgi:general secretion pathway protein G